MKGPKIYIGDAGVFYIKSSELVKTEGFKRQMAALKKLNKGN